MKRRFALKAAWAALAVSGFVSLPALAADTIKKYIADPSRDNIGRYLRVHIDDESLVTDELADYIHHAHTWSPDFIAARAQSVSRSEDALTAGTSTPAARAPRCASSRRTGRSAARRARSRP